MRESHLGELLRSNLSEIGECIDAHLDVTTRLRDGLTTVHGLDLSEALEDLWLGEFLCDGIQDDSTLGCGGVSATPCRLRVVKAN